MSIIHQAIPDLPKSVSNYFMCAMMKLNQMGKNKMASIDYYRYGASRRKKKMPEIPLVRRFFNQINFKRCQDIILAQ